MARTRTEVQRVCAHAVALTVGVALSQTRTVPGGAPEAGRRDAVTAGCAKHAMRRCRGDIERSGDDDNSSEERPQIHRVLLRR